MPINSTAPFCTIFGFTVVSKEPSQHFKGGSTGQGPHDLSVMHKAGFRSNHIAPDGKPPEVLDDSERPNGSWREFSRNYLFVDS